MSNRKILNEELGRLDIEEYKAAEKISLVIVLDNIRSMNNIGSVFRTADAFRVESILLCGITATPPSKEIHKTALGATDSVDWKYFEETKDAVDYLKERSFVICSVEQAKGSIDLDEFQIDPDQKYALIFGHEVRGVSQDIVDSGDYCIEIAQYGTKHSLNVSVAAGIVIWRFFNSLYK